MTRVPTYALHQLTLFHTLNTQARISDLSTQLASGKKSEAYSGVFKDAFRLVSLETRRAETSQFTQNIAIGDQRLELMDTTINSVEDLALELRDTLDRVLAQPDSAGGDITQIAANIQDAITGLLNTRYGDSYIFGGTRSDVAPVDFSAPGYTNVSLIKADGVTVDRTYYEAYYTQTLGNTLPFAQGSFYNQIFFDKNGVAPTGPLPADPDNPTLAEFVAEDPDLWQYYVDRMNSTQTLATPKVDYYQGDSNANVVRADRGLDVNYDIRADNLAFQQILSAADAIANLPNGDASDPNERTVIEKAHQMIATALGDPADLTVGSLTNMRVDISTARNTLKNASDRHEKFDAYAEGVLSDLENIDQADVIVRLQSDQRALEASYSMIGRLQNLSLLDFL
jgi:flagellin-like hook-associated protein FlgL